MLIYCRAPLPPDSCLFDKHHGKKANDYDVPHATSVSDDWVYPCCGLFELERWNVYHHGCADFIWPFCFIVVVSYFRLTMVSVRQGTQHFTDENKVSRKWSDSVHLLPFQLNKNNTTTHRVLVVKIQNQKSIKLSYNIYYKTHSQLYMRPTINH